MNTQKSGIMGAAGVVATMLLGLLSAATPAQAQTGIYYGGGPAIQADKNAARNIGIGFGAAAAYELSQGKGRSALALGIVAAVAGGRCEADRRAENATHLARIDCVPVVAEPRWAAPLCRVPVREDYRVNDFHDPFERIACADHRRDYRGWDRAGRDHGYDRPDPRFAGHNREAHEGWDRR